jgi:hypothetical protein
LIEKTGQCEALNLDASRFSHEIGESRKLNICNGIEEITHRLNNHEWSIELESELNEIWKSFTDQDIYFSPMPPNADSTIFAIAHSFPPGKRRDVFNSTIYLKNGVENKNFFYHVVLHELRHVFDFQTIFVSGTDITLFELERRAFRLMSRMDEETPNNKRFSKTPELWRDEWKNLDKAEIEVIRSNAILKFLKSSTHYKNLPKKEITIAKTPIAAEPNPLDLDVQSPPKLVRRRDP